MKLFSKKFIPLVLIIFIISGLFLFNVKEARANIFGNAAIDILQTLAGFLLKVAQWFAGTMGNLFTLILNRGLEKDMMGFIYKAWTITLYIINMFFILFLFVIAFATILRIETYGMKNLLVKFIIVALLINFSYLLCGIIIDAAQILANYFINQINIVTDLSDHDVGFGILNTLQVSKALTPAEGQTVAITTSDPELTTALNTTFSTVIIFVAGFVLLVGAILLILRVGALWLLIILAPFAWFFSIFPALKSHADKWWSELLKWSFFAPIYVFFIWLVLKIGESTGTLANSIENVDMTSGIALTEMMSNTGLFFFYVFLVILLLAAPQVAMSLGIKAAGTATAFAKGALKGTYKLPGKLRGTMIAPPGWMKALPVTKQIAAGLSFAAKWTTPAYWKTALQARKEERVREAGIPEALGKMQDISNRLLSFFTRKTNYAEQAHQFEVGEEVKRMMLRTKGLSGAVIKEMSTTKERTKRDAGFTILAGNNDFNDMLQHELFKDRKFSQSDKIPEDLRGQSMNRTFSREAFVDLFYQLQKEAGVSEKKASAFLANLQEQSLRAGTNFFGAAGMDEKGNWKRNSVETMNEISARKALTMDMRQWAQKTHPMSLVNLDVNNNYAGLDKGALIALVNQMTPGVAHDLDFTRSRIDFISKVGSPEAVADLRELAKDTTALPEASAREVITILADRLELAKEKGRSGKGPTSPTTPKVGSSPPFSTA